MQDNWLFQTFKSKVVLSVNRSGVGTFKILFTVIKTVLGKALQDNVVPIRQPSKIELTVVASRAAASCWQQTPRPLWALEDCLSRSSPLAKNEIEEVGLLCKLMENLKIKCPKM